MVSSRKRAKSSLYECKKYGEGKSGRRDLQILYAEIEMGDAHSGFFVTTGGFTKDAIEYAPAARIKLVGPDELVRMMFDSKPDATEDDFIVRCADNARTSFIIICGHLDPKSAGMGTRSRPHSIKSQSCSAERPSKRGALVHIGRKRSRRLARILTLLSASGLRINENRCAATIHRRFAERPDADRV